MTDRWVLGVDIGGTTTGVGAVPFEGGTAHALRSFDTRSERGGDAAVADIARVASEVMREVTASSDDDVEFVGVGIGCPGPLDLAEGIIIDTPNLGWDGYPVRARIQESLELPATLDNDANCATYGEWWQGAGTGVSSLVGVTLGTGIGGGFIENGRILHGASGGAGEVGHMTINFNGRRCACGNYGCLEAYASGPNIAARAREGLEAGERSILPELVDGELERITAATVYAAIVQGDAYAREVMTETARILGTGMANLVNIFNPERIVMVGGVTRAGEYLFGPLRSEVRRRAFRSSADACTIVPGALPDTAGVIGAAGIFLAEGPF